MDRDQVAFYAGLVLVAVGLIIWVARPNHGAGKSEIEFIGLKFSLDVPALAVMVIGIVIMVLSPRFAEPESVPSPSQSPAPAEAPVPESVKKVVCTGQYEKNCPGVHDIFYTCGYFGSDAEIAAKICEGVKNGYVRIKTVGGNKCGYALIEVTCKP